MHLHLHGESILMKFLTIQYDWQDTGLLGMLFRDFTIPLGRRAYRPAAQFLLDQGFGDMPLNPLVKHVRFENWNSNGLNALWEKWLVCVSTPGDHCDRGKATYSEVSELWRSQYDHNFRLFALTGTIAGSPGSD